MNEPTYAEDEAVEALVAEATDAYLDSLHKGERPEVETFARRYPAIETILRELLPAVCVMHRAGSSSGVAATPPAPPQASGHIGDFRLVREVGRGGMGVVYEAEQISLGRRVALKVLPMAAALDPRQLQRFRMEAQAAAHLHHSHIVPIYSVGCDQGIYFYAMQFVDGRSLEEVVTQLRQEQDAANARTIVGDPHLPAEVNETIPRHAALTARSVRADAYFRSVADMGIQIADALDYAHGMGVVHRDIKPANLLVDAQNAVYVADFGLAQLRDAPGVTMTGDLVGTLRYMSPEQALAQRGVVDHRTDIYSLGATLYEMVTLTPACDAPDRAALLHQITNDDPILPRRLNPSLPADLETIILKALAKEPTRRYSTAKELADDLRRYLEHRPIQARRPSPRERLAKWARRHRGLVTAGTVLLFLATLGFAISTALIAREQWKTQKALADLASEEERTRKAFEAEAAQRARAEASLRQARTAVDFFTELSEEELADKPELQGLRRKLLEASYAYYQDFIQQSRDDPSLQAELAAGHLRVASILDELGSRADALAALDRARQLQEKLVADKTPGPEFQRALFSIYHRTSMLRGGRELGLLNQKSVQEDIKLSGEQAQGVSRLLAKRREAIRNFRNLTPEEWRSKFEELEEQESALASLLRPEQTTRLRQIAVQMRGTDAYNDPDVARSLGLSNAQKEKIRLLQDEARLTAWAEFSSGDMRDSDRRRVEEAWRNARDQIQALLTDEQKERWKDLTGEPFKGRRFHHRGGGGGPPPRPGGPIHKKPA
jgi:serine/threonine protein kinase